LRCTYADDPRRPLLVVRAVGHDLAIGPEPLIAERLARVADAGAEPELAALIEDQRARIEHELEFSLRTPLDLASHLAGATERGGAAPPTQDRDQILGLPGSPDPGDGDGRSAAAVLVATIPELLDTRAGVLLQNPD